MSVSVQTIYVSKTRARKLLRASGLSTYSVGVVIAGVFGSLPKRWKVNTLEINDLLSMWREAEIKDEFNRLLGGRELEG